MANSVLHSAIPTGQSLCRGTCHCSLTSIIFPNKIKGSIDILISMMQLHLFTLYKCSQEGRNSMRKQIKLYPWTKYPLEVTGKIYPVLTTMKSSIHAPQPLPGKAWHSCCRWSHWQFRCSEQLLQLVSLLQICSFLT